MAAARASAGDVELVYEVEAPACSGPRPVPVLVPAPLSYRIPQAERAPRVPSPTHAPASPLDSRSTAPIHSVRLRVSLRARFNRVSASVKCNANECGSTQDLVNSVSAALDLSTHGEF